MPYHKFQHQEVRELAWLIASPSLFIEEESFSDQEFRVFYGHAFPWLMELDKRPALLQQALAKVKNTRLGFRFEALLAYWMQQQSDIRLLKQNWQIVHNKRTLGEFDFIIEKGQTEHWETAIKFYLGYGNKWYGPNAHDRLDLKSTLIFDKQLRFSSFPEVKEVLDAEGIHIAASKIWAKGILFEHAFGQQQPPLPENANPKCIAGKWLYLEEFAQLEEDRQWMLIPHQEWLDPFPANEVYSTKEILPNISSLLQTQDSIMLGEMRQDKMVKWFVVNGNWPN